MLKEMQLFSPHGNAIVGIRADDRTVRAFKYSYDRDLIVNFFVLDDGSPVGDSPTLVDNEGNDWPTAEVVYYSLFKYGK